MIRALAIACLALVWCGNAVAEPCDKRIHRDRAFTVCTADLADHRIEARLSDEAGAPLSSFEALERATTADILFAMNGGMYHADRAPVGLYVENGKQLTRLITREGPGNFGLLPNGVFCVGADRAAVIESRAFADSGAECLSATQSGPMLVIDGALHPRFLPDSPSRKYRNGVGVRPDGTTVLFVISDEPVTFHEMATLYRDDLDVRNALFLDGSVSRLHVPSQGRSDPGRAMGPILSVIKSGERR